MKKYSLLVVFLLVLSLFGCQNATYSGENIGTTCGNITMGAGSFAYRDGFIYFSDFGHIFEYDIEAKKAVTLGLKSDIEASSIFLSQDCVFFSNNGIEYITRDGKKHGMLYEREGQCIQVFADGQDLYFLDGIEGNLYHRDMNTAEETVLIARVNSYYVDDQSIYAVSRTEDGWKLFVSKRSDIQFDSVELSFEPIAVLATENAIYMAQKGTYQITKYQEGTETEYPLYGTYYQVLGDSIIYSDSTGYNNSCFPVKRYDMETGEEALLCEEVYDFCILEERYVCCECMNETGMYYILVDLESNTAVQMYPEVE